MLEHIGKPAALRMWKEGWSVSFADPPLESLNLLEDMALGQPLGTGSKQLWFKATFPKRKRRGGAINSRQGQKRTREAASTPEISLEAEPIELVETAGDEIVDLTCESLEPVVVDLTHNDSVVNCDAALPANANIFSSQTASTPCPVSANICSSPNQPRPPALPIVDERRRPRRNARRLHQDHADSCVVSSDDEELSRDRDVYVTTHTPRNTRDEGATGLRYRPVTSSATAMLG
ncbi:E3 ubiquitin-protein ligase rnf4, partial [Saguinus oedipus]